MTTFTAKITGYLALFILLGKQFITLSPRIVYSSSGTTQGISLNNCFASRYEGQ
jgi:hypothetical protein